MTGYNPWWVEDRDMGDETDPIGRGISGPPMGVCPKGHVAYLRPADHALFCHECGGIVIYDEAFIGRVTP